MRWMGLFCPCYFPANISMKWALPKLCCLFLCLCVQSVCSQSAAGKDHPHHQRSDQHNLQWDPQSLCSGNIEHQTVEWTVSEWCAVWQTARFRVKQLEQAAAVAVSYLSIGHCPHSLLFDFLYWWERNVQTCSNLLTGAALISEYTC